MTILEIERKSGLERTNIRFYEREGLINPVRKDNGYRDYSDADLDLLLKIKLLRRLGFSLDVIRSLVAGETKLDFVIQQRLDELHDEELKLSASRQVCHEMKEACASFSTLDAAHYLDSYDQALSTQTVLPASVPLEDCLEAEICPLRRFFARSFDLALIGLLSQSVFALAFRMNVARTGNMVEWAFGLLHWVILIFAEAFLLSRFSTTLGKWILGIRVIHITGRKLSFSEGLSRTGLIFVYGEGLTIPIVNLYRGFKSFRKLMNGEQLEWDTDNELIVDEMRWWRPIVYLLVLACVLVFTIYASVVPAMPVNRGAEITAEEFVENYNQLMKFHGIEGRELLLDGSFAEQKTSGVTIQFGLSELDDSEPIKLEFTEENGVLKEVSFQRRVHSTFSVLYYGGQQQEVVSLASMAYCWADAGVLGAAKTGELLDELSANQKGLEELELFGKHIRYEISERPSIEGTEFDVRFSITALS